MSKSGSHFAVLNEINGLFNVYFRFTYFSNYVIINLKKPSAANTRLNNWLGWGIPSIVRNEYEPTFGANLGVGSYFFL